MIIGLILASGSTNIWSQTPEPLQNVLYLDVVSHKSMPLAMRIWLTKIWFFKALSEHLYYMLMPSSKSLILMELRVGYYVCAIFDWYFSKRHESMSVYKVTTTKPMQAFLYAYAASRDYRQPTPHWFWSTAAGPWYYAMFSFRRQTKPAISQCFIIYRGACIMIASWQYALPGRTDGFSAAISISHALRAPSKSLQLAFIAAWAISYETERRRAALITIIIFPLRLYTPSEVVQSGTFLEALTILHWVLIYEYNTFFCSRHVTILARSFGFASLSVDFRYLGFRRGKHTATIFIIYMLWFAPFIAEEVCKATKMHVGAHNADFSLGFVI